MDIKLRKPKREYKHKPLLRIKISDDEWFIIIYIHEDGYALTAYEDEVGCRYLSRRSRVKYDDSGVRYVIRDKQRYYLPDDIH